MILETLGMKTWKLGAATIAAAAIATPSFAAGGPPADKPGTSQKGKQAQVAKGTTGATGAQGNAYGKLCKGVSKKKVAGQKGTPFSQCVKAMAKMDKNPKLSPGQACKGVSKKKGKGRKK